MNVQASRVLTIRHADRPNLICGDGKPELRERNHQVLLTNEAVLLKASKRIVHVRAYG